MTPRTRRSKIGLMGPVIALIMLGAGEPPQGGRPVVLSRLGIRTGPDSLPPALPDETQRPLHTVGPTPPASDLGTPLVPGQLIQPIDLPGALRLAGANDLDIAIAKERVSQSLAELQQARVLWLPSIYVGPNWIRHDGQVQTVQGQIQNVSKSSRSYAISCRMFTLREIDALAIMAP